MVAGVETPPFDLISLGAQCSYELAPSASTVPLVRHQLLVLDRHALAARCNGAVHLDDAAGVLAALRNQRAPGQDLPDVLHGDDAWRGVGAVQAISAQQLANPLQHHPRQGAGLPAARLAALGLAEVRAVRRGMEPADGAAGHVHARVGVPDILAVVLGQRVVGGVHADDQLIVVVGQGGIDAQGLLEALAGAAAAGEQVHNDLAGAQAGALRHGEVESAGAVSHWWCPSCVHRPRQPSCRGGRFQPGGRGRARAGTHRTTRRRRPRTCVRSSIPPDHPGEGWAERVAKASRQAFQPRLNMRASCCTPAGSSPRSGSSTRNGGIPSASAVGVLSIVATALAAFGLKDLSLHMVIGQRSNFDPAQARLIGQLHRRPYIDWERSFLARATLAAATCVVLTLRKTSRSGMRWSRLSLTFLMPTGGGGMVMLACPAEDAAQVAQPVVCLRGVTGNGLLPGF